MTFTNELFVMDDFVMTDSPAISPSPHLQSLSATDNTSSYSISGTITLDDSFDLASNLFPLIDDQFPNITINDTTTVEQFNSLYTSQEEGGLLVASSMAPEFEQVFFENDFQLQSSAATTQTQPILMIDTPELSSVYTSSYSPSIQWPSNLDHGYTIGLNTSLFLQLHQEEFLPSSYEAQQQDMVSPVSQFDLMYSPANSYSIMEEQSVYSATPPIQSLNSPAGDGDGRFSNTIVAMNSSRSASTQDKSRYDCPECDQTVGRSQDLKRHRQSRHSDIKHYHCDCCDRAFSRKDALKRHEKSKNRSRQKQRFQHQGQSISRNQKVSP